MFISKVFLGGSFKGIPKKILKEFMLDLNHFLEISMEEFQVESLVDILTLFNDILYLM